MKTLHALFAISTLLLCGNLQSATPSEDEKLGLHSDGGIWGIQWQKEIDPELPNVLLIGDSILIGYQKAVRRELISKANIDIWTTPEHLNSPNLGRNLKKALATRDRYDIVCFNIGLHGWAEGRIPEGQYGPLFESYLATIREAQPSAKIIWTSTTPVHTKNGQTLDVEINPTILERNAIASDICAKYDIPVNDLYGLCAQQMQLVRGDQFHWQGPAYEMMAKQTESYLLETLESL